MASLTQGSQEEVLSLIDGVVMAEEGILSRTGLRDEPLELLMTDPTYSEREAFGQVLGTGPKVELHSLTEFSCLWGDGQCSL